MFLPLQCPEKSVLFDKKKRKKVLLNISFWIFSISVVTINGDDFDHGDEINAKDSLPSSEIF